MHVDNYMPRTQWLVKSLIYFREAAVFHKALASCHASLHKFLINHSSILGILWEKQQHLYGDHCYSSAHLAKVSWALPLPIASCWCSSFLPACTDISHSHLMLCHCSVKETKPQRSSSLNQANTSYHKPHHLLSAWFWTKLSEVAIIFHQTQSQFSIRHTQELSLCYWIWHRGHQKSVTGNFPIHKHCWCLSSLSGYFWPMWDKRVSAITSF